MSSLQIQFWVKFYSSEYEWEFPATHTFPQIVEHIEGFFPKVSMSYCEEGITFYSKGEYIGTLKPSYPEPKKVAWLHELTY